MTDLKCNYPPDGWHCNLPKGHDGPCPTYFDYDYTELMSKTAYGQLLTFRESCIPLRDYFMRPIERLAKWLARRL
jgi:hypothetical protein